MISVGNRVTYDNGSIRIIIDDRDCRMANTEYNAGYIIKIESPKWQGLT